MHLFVSVGFIFFKLILGRGGGRFVFENVVKFIIAEPCKYFCDSFWLHCFYFPVYLWQANDAESFMTWWYESYKVIYDDDTSHAVSYMTWWWELYNVVYDFRCVTFFCFVSSFNEVLLWISNGIVLIFSVSLLKLVCYRK